MKKLVAAGKKRAVTPRKKNGKLTKADRSRLLNRSSRGTTAPRKHKAKAPRKLKTALHSDAAGATVVKQEPQSVPIEMLADSRFYPPVAVIPRCLPGINRPGPFIQVVVPTERPKPRIWVRVTKGDDRNGEGIVAVENPRCPLMVRGTRVSFVGGTAETPPRLSSQVVGEVLERVVTNKEISDNSEKSVPS